MHSVEEELLSNFGEFLSKQGWGSERVIAQVMLLAGSCAPHMASSAVEGSLPENLTVSTGLDQDVGDCTASVNLEAGAVEPPLIPDDQALPALGTFVVSSQSNSGFRRLHRVGECSYKPGVHYGVFEVLGVSLPAASEFHARCKRCFPAAPAASADAEEIATSSGSSSSDSS